RLWIVPVALEERGSLHEDLAVGCELDLEAFDGLADGSKTVVGLRGARGGAALGRAVALHDHDAQVLPRLLQRWRQERSGAHEEVQAPAQLAVHPPEQEPTGGIRESPRDAPQPLERLPAPTLVDLALDRAPEQI